MKKRKRLCNDPKQILEKNQRYAFFVSLYSGSNDKKNQKGMKIER
jgi:hypothetical protein